MPLRLLAARAAPAWPTPGALCGLQVVRAVAMQIAGDAMPAHAGLKQGSC